MLPPKFVQFINVLHKFVTPPITDQFDVSNDNNAVQFSNVSFNPVPVIFETSQFETSITANLPQVINICSIEVTFDMLKFETSTSNNALQYLNTHAIVVALEVSQFDISPIVFNFWQYSNMCPKFVALDTFHLERSKCVNFGLYVVEFAAPPNI